MSDVVRPEVQRMAGATALPRENGELVFDAPSQGRIFGLALGVVRARGIDWEEFRQRLMAAIEADPARQYYESWIAALDALVVDLGLASAEELEARAARIDR